MYDSDHAYMIFIIIKYRLPDYLSTLCVLQLSMAFNYDLLSMSPMHRLLHDILYLGKEGGDTVG